MKEFLLILLYFIIIAAPVLFKLWLVLIVIGWLTSWREVILIETRVIEKHTRASELPPQAPLRQPTAKLSAQDADQRELDAFERGLRAAVRNQPYR